MLLQEGTLGIYRSSAGSGKTYTLTLIYLTLALRDPQHFKHILAVTFTNKATQEMKGRIVHALFALKQQKEATLAASLLGSTGLSPHQLAQRADEVLSAILHQYSHFSVSTIDSFFQRVIRSFAREIGLQGGFSVELDQNKVLQTLVDGLLEQMGSKEKSVLTKWLIGFATERMEDGANWDIRRELELLGKEIFTEAYKLVEPALAQRLEAPDAVAALRKQLVSGKKTFEHTLCNLGMQAQLTLDEAGLTVDNFKWKNGGAVGFLLKQQYPPKKSGANWSFEYGSRVQQAIDQPQALVNQKATAAERSAADALAAILEEAVRYIDNNAKTYFSAQAVLKNYYSYGILTRLAEGIREYRDEHDVMLISDANDFLQQIIDGNDTPFIYEKVGAHFQHFLIDEFQDTSVFQWENLRPLVLNSLDEGHANLIVGDIKQSIYRWRGGDWRLLLEKVARDLGPGRVKTTTLSINWRSLPEVIHFNNALFEEAPTLLASHFREEIANVTAGQTLADLEHEATKLEEAYEDVAQATQPNKEYENAGAVEVCFLADANDGEADPNLALLPTWLEEAQDLGIALKDIAFLVRTKREGQAIADYLLEYQNNQGKDGYRYDVISSEALALDSAPAVRVLLQALQYVHFPENDIARAHLIFEYQGYLAQKAPSHDLHTLFAKPTKDNSPNEWLPEAFESQKETLGRTPLFECVEALIPLFELQEVAGQFAYLQGFQDAVLEYARQEQTDLGGFLSWWAETGKKRSVQVPEELDAARILTIHKSKGLQYKVVLVPFTHWDLDHGGIQANFLWVDSNQPPLEEAGPLPIRYSSALRNTVFQKAYFQEKLWALLDNLNILYVAFTRAEEILRVGAKRKGKKETLNTVADLLWALAPTLGQAEAALWNEEEQKLFWGAWPTPTLAKPLPAPTPWEWYPTASWKSRLKIRQSAEDFFHIQEAGKAATVEHGVLAHRLLALVHTADQLNEATQTLIREGVLSETTAEELNAVTALVRRVLDHPEAKPWFSGGWKVRTEVPILPRSGELKRLDRVMTKDGAAIVVDFKTGQPTADTLEKHKRQVGYYAKLLREMGYQQVGGYIMYLQTPELIEVR